MRYTVSMNEVLHANIFFILASIGTVIFMIFITAILWHVLKMVKTIRAILERIERASDIIASDAMEFRSSVKTGMIGRIMSWFMNK